MQPIEIDESTQVQLSRVYPGLKYLQSAKLLQLPIPKNEDGQFVTGENLISFVKEIFEIVKSLKREENE